MRKRKPKLFTRREIMEALGIRAWQTLDNRILRAQAAGKIPLDDDLPATRAPGSGRWSQGFTKAQVEILRERPGVKK